jgi:hypothetical protein
MANGKWQMLHIAGSQHVLSTARDSIGMTLSPAER